MQITIERDKEENQEDFDNFCDKIITDIATMRRRIGQRISIKGITRYSKDMEIVVDITPVDCKTL